MNYRDHTIESVGDRYRVLDPAGRPFYWTAFQEDRFASVEEAEKRIDWMIAHHERCAKAKAAVGALTEPLPLEGDIVSKADVLLVLGAYESAIGDDDSMELSQIAEALWVNRDGNEGYEEAAVAIAAAAELSHPSGW